MIIRWPDAIDSAKRRWRRFTDWVDGWVDIWLGEPWTK